MANVSDLDGFFKRRYADKPEDLVPDHADFAEAIPFSKREKTGDDYQVTVRLKRAQGVTYGSDGSAFTLNAAIPGQSKPARANATSFVLRETVSYDAAGKATNSDDAFGDAFDAIVMDMENSASLHREMMILYGQSNLGAVTANGSSSASVQYTLTEASSAVGLWLQLQGAVVDVYDPTLTTQRNSVGDMTVSAVGLSSNQRQVLVTLAGATADNAAVVAGDVIVPKGWVGESFAGVDKIATNSGSLFGIDASLYALWQANLVSAGSAALTMSTLTSAAAMQVQRSGQTGKKLTAFCSYLTWNNLNNDAAALRRFAQSTKGSVDLGTMGAITYYGPGVAIDIKPSGLVKNGELFMADWATIKRVGATDITFTLPGNSPNQEKFFLELGDKAGYELRCYFNQCIIPTRPASITKITGIVNN
ncbi:hypothetical protein [Sandaracinus amylolyticus]|uniref:hypothetical protein n=1 Tax=Sandaracinus amylolyticus TaxID=927083 RepID=UPI001F1D3651|nr:hypothetical protein [Sandaracinus amylolyticus]UJR78926.1 Hypothetical protein I5071_9590 [Sandaracinus amylolyticus]